MPLRQTSELSFHLALFTAVALALAASSALAAPGDSSPDALWREVSEPVALVTLSAEQRPRPRAFRSFELQSDALTRVLDAVPTEGPRPLRGSTVSLPRPDGSFERFEILESPILGPSLQASHPDIRTFVARGIDDPTATGRLDLTMHGFRAFVRSSEGVLVVDPYVMGNTDLYMSYWKADASAEAARWECLTEAAQSGLAQSVSKAIPSSGDALTSYRMAITLTGEYMSAFASVAAGEAEAVTTINRVTAVFEIDAAVRFSIVAFNSYADAATDPFPNGASVDTNLITQNHNDLVTKVGVSNFDIGHLFTVSPSLRGLGGTFLGNACVDTAKGQAASGMGIPFGVTFAIDLVAHEVGHQMNGSHIFNGSGGTCMEARQWNTAYEPGSGSTVMSYSGNCGGDNVTVSSHTNFNHHNVEQIVLHRNTTGCGTVTATGNTPPVANAGPNRTIPRETPFALTGSATDVDDDVLSYSWEQHDLGSQTPPTDWANGPLFRAREPKSSPTRHMPDEQFSLNPGFANFWELLPIVDRTLHFRLVVRDNAIGGGGIDDDEMLVFVSGAPFRISSPNGGESYLANSTATVNWSVGGGAIAANVRLLFSDDDGASWSEIVTSTPNDGSHDIVMPCAATSEGRLRVEALGQIFYDVSDNGFSVTQSAPIVNGGSSFTPDQAGCVFSGNIGASIVDDDPSASLTVEVTATVLSGAATVSTPSFVTSPFGVDDLLVIGSVVVSEITASPVQVEIVVSGTDPCGLTSEIVQTFDFHDTTSPAVNCPAELTAQATSPAGIDKDDAVLAAFFAGASATDNCVTPIALSDDAPLTIPAGTNPISFSAIDGAGNIGSCQVDLIVEPANDTTPALVDATALRAIYPNPFNPRATIVFSLKSQQRATVEIFNQQGQRVRQLFSGVKSAGLHELEWSGRDDAGQSVASGVYIFKLRTAEGTFSKPAALIK